MRTFCIVLVAIISTVFLVSLPKTTSSKIQVGEQSEHTATSCEVRESGRYMTEPVKVDEGRTYISANGYVYDAPGYLVKVCDAGDPEVEYTNDSKCNRFYRSESCRQESTCKWPEKEE